MIMHKMKSVLAVGLMLMGTAVWAQTPPAEANSSTKLQAPIQPYADNPNLLHVWAIKHSKVVLTRQIRLGKWQKKVGKKYRPWCIKPGEIPKTLTTKTTQKPNKK